MLQVVELQARILGFIHGGATIRPRGFRFGGPGGAPDGSAAAAHLAFLDSLDDEGGAEAA